VDVRREQEHWLDLTADLLSRPSGAFAHAELLVALGESFDCISSWHLQTPDGGFSFDLNQPIPGFPATGELEAWSRTNCTSHPLLWWYRTTLDTRPMTIERVPRAMAPADGFGLVHDLCAPHGLERQLSIPYELGEGHRAFVLAQSGADFSDEQVELARFLHPLITLLARQGRVLGGHEPSPGDEVCLTGRERAVLVLLSRGLTAQAIAHALGMSTRTVHTHLAHVYRKLGVCDRLQAVTVAERIGLLRPDAEPTVDDVPTEVVFRPTAPSS
jgi:DNA-binding CsgD family transcriptional regulator